VLQDGQARVSAGGQFVDLLNPGDTAIITSTGGKIRITRVSSPPWTFAGACAANLGLSSTDAGVPCASRGWGKADAAETPKTD